MGVSDTLLAPGRNIHGFRRGLPDPVSCIGPLQVEPLVFPWRPHRSCLQQALPLSTPARGRPQGHRRRPWGPPAARRRTSVSAGRTSTTLPAPSRPALSLATPFPALPTAAPTPTTPRSPGPFRVARRTGAPPGRPRGDTRFRFRNAPRGRRGAASPRVNGRYRQAGLFSPPGARPRCRRRPSCSSSASPGTPALPPRRHRTSDRRSAPAVRSARTRRSDR